MDLFLNSQFCSVDLYSSLMPVLHGLDYCSFIVILKWERESPPMLFFFKIVLAILGTFIFIGIEDGLVNFCTKSWTFDRLQIDL